MNSSTVQELWIRCKSLADRGIGDWGLVLVVVLVGVISFGLGRFSAMEETRPPVSVQEVALAVAPRSMKAGGLVVASRRGSVYYFPWCSGAQKISAQSQVWFASENEALNAGYTPSKSCKGLEGQ